MKEENLTKKTEELANKFKQRALKGPSDTKRHDRIWRDEQKRMWIAHNEQGWSFAKIGSVFNRDSRTVKKVIDAFKPEKRRMSQSASNQDPLITEAKRKHCEEIHTLAESWKEYLSTASLLSHPISFDYPVEDELHFPRVLQHSPSVKDSYEVLKVGRDEYKTKMAALEQRIGQEVPVEGNEQFAKAVVQSCLYVVEGLSPLCYKIENECLIVSATSDFHQSIGIAKGVNRVLGYCQQCYIQLINKYQQIEEVKVLIDKAQNLRNLEKVLARAITESLLKYEYISYKCGSCP